MSYHASGVPRMPTGSIVTPPVDVRVSPRYGNGISASGYRFLDRNGFSVAVMKEAARGSAKVQREAKAIREHSRIAGRVSRAQQRVDSEAKLRAIAGDIGNIE